MISWWIIAILIILVFLFLRMRHFKHKIFAVVVILVLLFVYITVTKVISENKVDLKSFNGLVTAGKVYFSWLGNAIVNVKDLTTSAIKMDWVGNLTK